jgi:hypothetical protein
MVLHDLPRRLGGMIKQHSIRGEVRRIDRQRFLRSAVPVIRIDVSPPVVLLDQFSGARISQGPCSNRHRGLIDHPGLDSCDVLISPQVKDSVARIHSHVAKMSPVGPQTALN